jgi:hypothetical protein
MRKLRTRAIVVTSCLGAPLITAFAVPAMAGATTVTGGTTTITLSASYDKAADRADISIRAKAGATGTQHDDIRTLNLPVTGGDADVDNFTGQLQQRGSLVFVNGRNDRRVTVTNIQLDYITNAVAATVPGTTGPVALFDLDGLGTSSSSATSQSFSASQLDVDASGAAALDQALHTNFFVAGQTIGSFATNYTIA